MAWGKESYDELRSLNFNMKSIESLIAEILNQISKDQDLKFWQEAMITCASGILANDTADNVFRPDMIAGRAAIVADSLLEARNKKIKELESAGESDEDSI